MSVAQRSRGSALIVEDDAVLALSLEQALHDAGIATVWRCVSAAEAMACLSRARPTVLVLDVRLQDRDDGWALAELACQVSVPSPLIVFSTGVPEAVPSAIAALGHVLVKPYDPRQLTHLVCGRERAAERPQTERPQEGGGVLGRIRRILR